MANQEIKDLLLFGSSVAVLIDTVTKGLSIAEVGQVLAVIKEAPGMLSEAPKALDEYLALDDAGRSDVEAYVSTLFPLQEKPVADVIKEVLTLVISLSSVIGLVKHSHETVKAAATEKKAQE